MNDGSQGLKRVKEVNRRDHPRGKMKIESEMNEKSERQLINDTESETIMFNSLTKTRRMVEDDEREKEKKKEEGKQ